MQSGYSIATENTLSQKEENNIYIPYSVKRINYAPQVNSQVIALCSTSQQLNWLLILV